MARCRSPVRSFPAELIREAGSLGLSLDLSHYPGVEHAVGPLEARIDRRDHAKVVFLHLHVLGRSHVLARNMVLTLLQ